MSGITAFGEILIDFAPVSNGADGYPVLAAHPGGAPANFLAAASRFGVKCSMIGKVGGDAFGRKLIETLKGQGIDTSGVRVSDDVFTTLAFVTVDASGERSFSFARKPGADTCLTAEEVDKALIDGADIFHFGTLSLTAEPSKSALEYAVDYAKSKGKLISCDPNLRLPLWSNEKAAKEAMLWWLEKADIVKISDDEASFLFGLTPEESAAHILEEFGVKLVFVTCGANGCVFANRLGSDRLTALRGITVRDTTGAGDIFGGTAEACILRSGKSPEDLDPEELRSICRIAGAAAGLSTERPGGISSIPSKDEVLEVLKGE